MQGTSSTANAPQMRTATTAAGDQPRSSSERASAPDSPKAAAELRAMVRDRPYPLPNCWRAGAVTTEVITHSNPWPRAELVMTKMRLH